MNPDPDYSAAYVILKTDGDHEGHGLTFTIGRGNEICVAAIKALEPLVVGLDMNWVAQNMGAFWRLITSDSQLRWIGPDKGAIHLATGAVVNAVWDLWAKIESKPVWQLVGDMTPEEIVRCIDFRYITDCITPEEALALLTDVSKDKSERQAILKLEGYPCYTTSAGWLGYSDEKLRRLCREAVDSGFNYIKMKVGHDLEDDIRRLTIARDQLAFVKPWFIEEPTSPDDIEGHRKIREGVKPVAVATGEMCQNRIMFKQLIMREAIDVVQINACRLGGVNEILAVLLMAAKHNLKVCPHAGGVGLCEYVQHLSMIDYLCFSGTREGRVIEYVDHLHEHFVDPCLIANAAYMPPENPGFSIQMHEASLDEYEHGAG
ncbi:UNVERIFIED_CONTAM: hypothetical protein GTU68_001567 [Idotea baltica]|nr:hypothetical protein [Idotea baltica]